MNILPRTLAKFWFAVWTQRSKLTDAERKEVETNGGDLYPEMYTIASLRNLRNGLTRCPEERGRGIDLTTDPRYKISQKSFMAACKELKRIGKGETKNYPEIDHTGEFSF